MYSEMLQHWISKTAVMKILTSLRQVWKLKKKNTFTCDNSLCPSSLNLWNNFTNCPVSRLEFLLSHFYIFSCCRFLHDSLRKQPLGFILWFYPGMIWVETWRFLVCVRLQMLLLGVVLDHLLAEKKTTQRMRENYCAIKLNWQYLSVLHFKPLLVQ